jgi:hypothetical protein
MENKTTIFIIHDMSCNKEEKKKKKKQQPRHHLLLTRN